MSSGTTPLPPAAVTATLLPSGLAVLHLARPAKLNALDTAACEAAGAAVRAFERDARCRGLLITGGPAPNGRPAFCAGGDVRAIRAAARASPFPPAPPPPAPPFPPPPPSHACERVFQAEYALLATLAGSRLPAVCLVDGVWMGLGVGVALAAGGGGGGRGVRVATERTLCAMPEASIGLFPDVAFAALSAAHLRPPGVGLWMGLTGGRVSGGGASVAAGLATHALPAASLPALTAALEDADLGGGEGTPLDLADPGAVAAGRAAAAAALVRVVEGAGGSAGPLPGEDAASASALSAALASVLPLLRPVADWAPGRGGCSSISSALLEALAALDGAARANPAAAAAATGMRAACPLSLALTVRLFATPSASLVAQLATELAPAARLAGSPHFAEGVRCALVDRGAMPAWPPPGASLEGVTDADVEALLAPLPQGGLRAAYWEGLAAPGGGGGGKYSLS